MVKRFVGILLFLWLSACMGCTPGTYTKIDSSAPSLGPIFVNTTRGEAERHLGDPIATLGIDDNRYRNIYAYEMERSGRYARNTDAIDVVTFNLNTLIVSPIDRFQGPRHLMAITYEKIDTYRANDRVIEVIEKCFVDKDGNIRPLKGK